MASTGKRSLSLTTPGEPTPPTDPPFGGGVFIADKSAWKFARHESVRDERGRALLGGQIAVTSLVILELLYSTRDAQEFAELQEELSALPSARTTQGTFDAGITAVRELSERSPGYHCVMPPDALIAAAAAERGWGFFTMTITSTSWRRFSTLRAAGSSRLRPSSRFANLS